VDFWWEVGGGGGLGGVLLGTDGGRGVNAAEGRAGPCEVGEEAAYAQARGFDLLATTVARATNGLDA